MSTPSSVKGARFEASLVPLLEQFWPDTVQLGKRGTLDKGDFHMPGNRLYIVEAKNEKRIDLPGYWREAQVEAGNAGVPFGVVVHKRHKTTAPEEQWATMSFGHWLQLVHRLNAGSAEG